MVFEGMVWWTSNRREGDYDTATRASVLARVYRACAILDGRSHPARNWQVYSMC